MSIVELDLQQEVVSNNKEIFERIVQNIKEAQKEILVATAWFTDEILFDALLSKAQTGLHIDLIIADNPENEKLEFNRLVLAGASVLKIKNVGYGMMHQKFCVIDKAVALHGSYNWSVNAKNNNHESIIITNHNETVESLITTFHQIKKKAIAILEGMEVQPIEEISIPQSLGAVSEAIDQDQKSQFSLNRKESLYEDPSDDYAQVIKSIIASETIIFDRNQLKNEGFERSQSTHGDPSVLTTALDSVYAGFVQDINIAEEKKASLLTKIDELQVKTKAGITAALQLKLNSIDSDRLLETTLINAKIGSLKNEILSIEKTIEGITNIKIKDNERKIDAYKEEIKKCEKEFITPKWRLYEVIPVSLFAFVLLIYLFLFYSSAAYILIFMESDAKFARMNNIEIAPPEVWNPDAIGLVWEKGFVASLFVFLFVIVPLALCCVKIFTKSKLWRVVMTIIAIVVVDGFIAVKVSMAIHEIDYLRGAVTTDFVMSSIWYNPNFYLVFVLGALGLVLFKFAFDKLISIFEERNPDINTRKNEVHIRQLNTEVEEVRENNHKNHEDIHAFEKEALLKQNEVKLHEVDLLILPQKSNNLVEKLNLEYAKQLDAIENITTINKSNVESNNVPIHIDSIKDRINVYLDGWDSYLYSEFASAKARDKSNKAAARAAEWQKVKLVREKIDKRIMI